MKTIIERLGWRDTAARRLWLAVIIAGCTGTWLSTGVAAAALRLPQAVFHAVVWTVWFVWLAYYFPAHRDRVLRSGVAAPYAHAFYRDILCGITAAFSQVLRPALWVDIPMSALPVWRLAAAAVLIGGGTAMIALAANVLGIARALFVYEYEPEPAAVVRRGIYRQVRHPMFLGGIIISVGCALLSTQSTALWNAAVNLAALLPYRLAEDSRCRRVFGAPYAQYSAAVDAFVPAVAADFVLMKVGPTADRGQL